MRPFHDCPPTTRSSGKTVLYEEIPAELGRLDRLSVSVFPKLVAIYQKREGPQNVLAPEAYDIAPLGKLPEHLLHLPDRKPRLFGHHLRTLAIGLDRERGRYRRLLWVKEKAQVLDGRDTAPCRPCAAASRPLRTSRFEVPAKPPIVLGGALSRNRKQ